MINITTNNKEQQDYDYKKWCYYLPEQDQGQEQGQGMY